jgi:hypothetical protein
MLLLATFSPPEGILEVHFYCGGLWVASLPKLC